MKEIFGVFAAGALMVVCCLLPIVLIGAGSAGIASILAEGAHERFKNLERRLG